MATPEQRKKRNRYRDAGTQRFSQAPDLKPYEVQRNLRGAQQAQAAQQAQRTAEARARAQQAAQPTRPNLRSPQGQVPGVTRAIKTQPTPSGGRVSLGAEAQRQVGTNVEATRKILEDRKLAEASAKAQQAATRDGLRQQFVGRNPELKNLPAKDVDRVMRLEGKAEEAAARFTQAEGSERAREGRRVVRAQNAADAARARAGQAPATGGAQAKALQGQAADVKQELDALKKSAGSNPPENVQKQLESLQNRYDDLRGKSQIEGAKRGTSPNTQAALDKTTPRKQIKAAGEVAEEVLDKAKTTGGQVVEGAKKVAGDVAEKLPSGEQVRQTAVKTGGAAADAVQRGVDEVADTARGFKEGLKSTEEVGRQAGEAVREGVDKASETVQEGVEKAKETGKKAKSTAGKLYEKGKDVGGKVLKGTGGTVGRGLKAAGKLLAPVALGYQAAKTASTPSEEYRKRFGLRNPYDDTRTYDEEGNLVAVRPPSIGGAVADYFTRGLGTLGDMASDATMGLIPSNFGIGPGDAPEEQAAAVAQGGGGPPPAQAIATRPPGSDEIGTSGFRRTEGPQQPDAAPDYTVTGPRGSYATRTSGRAASAGGGTFNVVPMPSAADIDKQWQSVRDSRNAIRTAQGLPPVGATGGLRGGGGVSSGKGYAETGFGARQRMKNMMRGKPEYDPNLTPRQNNARLANWQAGVDAQLVQEGIDPRSGAITGERGLRGRFGNQSGSLSDQIAMAGLQQRSAKDAFDQQMKLAELGSKLDKQSLDQVSSVTDNVFSDDPGMQEQGLAQALQWYQQYGPDHPLGQVAEGIFNTVAPEMQRGERGLADAAAGFFGYGSAQPSSRAAGGFARTATLGSTPFFGERVDLGTPGMGQYGYLGNDARSNFVRDMIRIRESR